jgi:SIR2-like domain
MSSDVFSEIFTGLYDNTVVPYLGAGVLFDVKNPLTGEKIPADSHSLILAMNKGQPMAPKLMYEFPRAAMNQELKKGRNFVNQFLTSVYGKQEWTRSAIHDWLAEWKPAYVIDINRDTQLQEVYADEEHTLIVGVARITASAFRFKIYHYDGSQYFEIAQEQLDKSLPILFKPMGTPKPEANYIASDADYVDYITELMGGFAIPDYLKSYRQGKKYLLLGMSLNRDSERMVLSDILYGAADPKGWYLTKNPTEKELRFCKRLGLEIVPADVEDFLQAAGVNPAHAEIQHSH